MLHLRFAGTVARAALMALAFAACGGADTRKGSDEGFAPQDPGGSGAGGSAARPSIGANAPSSPAGSAGVPATPPPGFMTSPTANTNVALGGSQDFGYFRRLLAAGRVPETKDFDAAGFFAEHHTKLPPPACGQRVCLQPMLAVMGNLATGSSCTMLQLGLNSPLAPDPSKRPPLNLILSVDVSGSMQVGGKIDFVRAGLERLIDGLRDGDKVAIVTYSDRATLVFPLAEVSLQRAKLREIARGLQATGGTALHDGLRLAYEEALKGYDSGRQNRVVLLSDGHPTIGITNPMEIMAMSKRYNSDGLGLTTIGLGTDFNPTLMRGLAQQADGNFYFLENSGAVSEVFTEELSYFTVPVAFDLKVELEAGSQYNFGRAYGTSFWKDSGITGGRLEVPSVFLAHRQSHADQTMDGGRRGGGSALLIELMPKRTNDDGTGIRRADVATIKLTFREPGTNKIVTDTIIVDYPNPPWFTPETGFFQSADTAIIQKSFVMMNIYVALEEASRRFHLRNTRDIIGDLQRLRAAVVDYNEEVMDKDIESDIKLLDDFIGVLRRNGVIDPTQVMIPRNPWPAD